VAVGEGGGFGPAAWVRATTVVGRLAEQRAGLNLGRLDEQEVRRRASRQLGRTITGDDPGLRLLLADLAQAPLTPMGRLWLRSELIRREVTQARLGDEVRRRPGLLDTPLPRPLIVVVGLPRTGTTLLHTLLGCDPQALVLPFWQLRRLYPIPRRRLERATRMLRAAAMARLARSMTPQLRDIHPVAALGPEEDVFLFCDTGMLAVPVAAPGYLGWLQATDPTPGYRTYRRHLQALSHDRPGRRPVLKSPVHLGRLAALLAEVPEAVVGGPTVIPPWRWPVGAAWPPCSPAPPATRWTFLHWAGAGLAFGRPSWIGRWRPGPPPIRRASTTWGTRRWWPTRSVRWSGCMPGWAWRYRPPPGSACAGGSAAIMIAAAVAPSVRAGRLRAGPGRRRPALRALPRLGRGGHPAMTPAATRQSQSV
jgi:sulfotransferase family protein